MIISIASGKGGTGKTTVATNLAVSLRSQVQILDCDVEEPNAHLFIQPHMEEIGETVLPFVEMCHSCGGCMEVCPEKFVHGKLRVGEAMSPPLIKSVRQYTRPDMLTIIDAPPGTSCPVIASMKGADFVLLVTEPTPFGLHDLKLAVGAVRILGIPCGLVINRSDMGDDRVLNYAKKESVPVLMEIPFIQLYQDIEQIAG